MIKRAILDGFPVVFGFPLYDSVESIRAPDYLIQFPGPRDRLLGGHAVLAAGYDDDVDALIIRNSWGTGWGDRGYGHLHYDYVRGGLATDFWCIFKQDWVRLDQFN